MVVEPSILIFSVIAPPIAVEPANVGITVKSALNTLPAFAVVAFSDQPKRKLLVNVSRVCPPLQYVIRIDKIQ